MKIILCFAFLLLAAQANPLAEFYLGFAENLDIDPQVQKDGVQCILQAEDALHTFISILHTMKDPQSIESIIQMSFHLLSEIESTIPASCKAAIKGLTKYWITLASTTNVKQNLKKFRPEIIRALGFDVFYCEITQSPRTPRLAGRMFSEKFKWILGVSEPADFIDTSSIKPDPDHIVPLNPEAFFPQFLSGLFRSFYINNQALPQVLAQCAVDLTKLAVLFEHGAHMSERIAMESVTKVVGSCKKAHQFTVAYLDRYLQPRKHSLGETLYYILRDGILNYPIYNKYFLTGNVKLQEGSYVLSGNYFGVIFRYAFRSLVPLEADMPY